MKCEICGKNYIALGVHVVVKHGVSTEDYREEFGLMKTAPLVDADLSDHMSKMAKLTFAARGIDEQGEIRERCKANAKNQDAGRTMSDAGKIALAGRSRERNKIYLTSRANEVTEALKENKSYASVRKQLGIGRNAVLGMRNLGLVKYDAQEAKVARLATVKNTIDKRRAPAIARIAELHDSEMTNSEMCRAADVLYTTYKKWVRAGLCAPRKRYVK